MRAERRKRRTGSRPIIRSNLGPNKRNGGKRGKKKKGGRGAPADVPRERKKKKRKKRKKKEDAKACFLGGSPRRSCSAKKTPIPEKPSKYGAHQLAERKKREGKKKNRRKKSRLVMNNSKT